MEALQNQRADTRHEEVKGKRIFHQGKKTNVKREKTDERKTHEIDPISYG